MAFDHLHVGQPVGKRLLHLRVLATRDVDAGFEAAAVTAESGSLALETAPLIVDFALSARQRLDTLVGGRTRSSHLLKRGLSMKEIRLRLGPLRLRRLEGQLDLARTRRSRATSLADDQSMKEIRLRLGPLRLRRLEGQLDLARTRRSRATSLADDQSSRIEALRS